MLDTVRDWLSRAFGLTEAITLGPQHVGIDPDDYLYRPLTGRSTRDLSAWDHEKMLALAGHLDRANMVSQRLLDLLMDFVFGEGVQVQARNSAVQDLLDEHWRDPINKWDKHGPELFRLMLRDGDVVVPAGINEVDGRVKWGLIPARKVKQTVPDPNDWRITQKIILKPDKPGDDPRTLAGIAPDLESGTLMGDAMFLKFGNIDGLRGISWLYSRVDFLDGVDQTMINELDRMALLMLTIWDVTWEGATPDQIANAPREERFQMPKPGSVRVHDEAIEWKAVTPDLKSSDSTNLLEFLVNTMILGAAGIPEHWFGSGGDVNRAVGAVMGEPTLKMLGRLQRIWADHVHTMMQYVVDRAVEKNTLPAVVEVEDMEGNGTGEMIQARDAIEVLMPDMNPGDTGDVANTLKTIVAALSVAEDNEYISNETSQRLFLLVASQLGIEVDPSIEREKIAAEAEMRAEKERERLEQQQQDGFVPGGQQPPTPFPHPAAQQQGGD